MGNIICNEYLMEVEQFFGGKYRFQVTASNEEDAKLSAEIYIDTFCKNRKDNFIMDTLHVIRKLKPSFY